MPSIYADDLVERTFLLNKEGRPLLRTRIVKAIDNFEFNLAREPSRLKFVCFMNDYIIDEILTYNELLDRVNNSIEDYLVEWKFKVITEHEGMLMRHVSTHYCVRMNVCLAMCSCM